MRACARRQHPAAQAGVVFKIERFHDLDNGLDLGVTELANVKLNFPLSCTGRPPQEHIPCRLHGTLAHNHTLPGMFPRAGSAIRLQHGLARLLELQEQRITLARHQQHDPAGSTHAAHTHHLEGDIHNRESI